MMGRNKTQLDRLGSVRQAGLDTYQPARRPLDPLFGLMRAVVLNTYVYDDVDNSTGYRVECDVVLVKSFVQLPRVVVSQASAGVNNIQTWVPKPSTRNLVSTQPMSLQPMSMHGTQAFQATPLSDLDGDHVLVDFIEGDPSKPVILRALPHPRSKRLIYGANGNVAAQLGWSESTPAGDTRGKPARNEHYVSHQGTEIRVNGQGDLLIDTVGATTDPDTETPGTSNGVVRVRMKGTTRFTVEMDGADVLEVFKSGAQVRIDLGEGATERLVLGDSFMSFFNAHTHPTGTGPSGTPTTPMTATLLSDVAKTRKT